MAISSIHEPAFPEALRHLGPKIAESREILELADDWDDEGSPGYQEDTWERASGFLVRSVIALWEAHGIVTDHALILPGPNGSVDLDWRAHGRELLINVPSDPSEPATCHGDDGAGGRRIKGTLDLGLSNRWLLLWLAE